MDRIDFVAPPTKRRWPIVLVVLLLLAGAGTFAWVLYTGSAYRRAVAFADAHDPGWRIEELLAKRATYEDDANGAVKVMQVQSMLPKAWIDPKVYDYLTDLRPEQLMNDQQAASVRASLKTAGPALVEARKMIDRPHGRHSFNVPPDFISLRLDCQANREVLGLLRLDALDLSQSEDADGALAACHAMLHCGTSIGDEPTTISMLVRIACQTTAVNSLERVLAQGTPSDKGLAELQARVTNSEAEPLFLIGVRGERAGQFHLLENIRNGNVNTRTLGGLGGGSTALDALGIVPGVMTHQITGSLTFLNELVEIAKTPPETWTQPIAALESKVPTLPLLAKLLAPAVTKPAEACVRNYAYMRCAVTAIAAERFRIKTSHWPASLDELVEAGLLKTVPVDPFDGKPLRLKHTDDGLIVYTIGHDRTDNGGNLDRAKQLQPGTDLGFRLWDVPKRRQPAPPPKPKEPAADQAPGAP